MRANAYQYENDLGKDSSLLPFFTITAAQEAKLKSRSSTNYNMLTKWQDIANDTNYNYPQLWTLRPNKSLTGDQIFAQILALPTKDVSWAGETFKVPTFQTTSSDGRFFLRADTEDVIIVAGKIVGKTKSTAWNYKGRKITPDAHNNKWYIESFHPNFSWLLVDSPANPVFEYTLAGSLNINGRNYRDHPDAPFVDPNVPDWKVPSRFGSLDIRSSRVYGADFGGSNNFKHLSFMDALDVAINWIVAFEHAYGVVKD